MSGAAWLQNMAYSRGSYEFGVEEDPAEPQLLVKADLFVLLKSKNLPLAFLCSFCGNDRYDDMIMLLG
jgi:hypothetical protein